MTNELEAIDRMTNELEAIPEEQGTVPDKAEDGPHREDDSVDGQGSRRLATGTEEGRDQRSESAAGVRGTIVSFPSREVHRKELGQLLKLALGDCQYRVEVSRWNSGAGDGLTVYSCDMIGGMWK